MIIPDYSTLAGADRARRTVCMAKTQYSFSHDPKLKGVPTGAPSRILIVMVRCSQSSAQALRFPFGQYGYPPVLGSCIPSWVTCRRCPASAHVQVSRYLPFACVHDAECLARFLGGRSGRGDGPRRRPILEVSHETKLVSSETSVVVFIRPRSGSVAVSTRRFTRSDEGGKEGCGGRDVWADASIYVCRD